MDMINLPDTPPRRPTVSPMPEAGVLAIRENRKQVRTFASWTAANISSASARLLASGFSHRIDLPYRARLQGYFLVQDSRRGDADQNRCHPERRAYASQSRMTPSRTCRRRPQGFSSVSFAQTAFITIWQGEVIPDGRVYDTR